MKCGEYKRHWFDEVSDEDFAAHCAACAECREAVEMDTAIETAARTQPGPRPAPQLWERIAAGIEPGRPSAASARPARGVREVVRAALTPRGRPGWGYGAALAAGAALALFLFLRPAGSPEEGAAPNLLTARALDRVEALEEEYAGAIAELEDLAGPALESADAGLRLRYRKRLEIIDDQILRCRAVLERDSGNAHVRRYLLAAYQDKKETLVAILESVEGRPAAGRS